MKKRISALAIVWILIVSISLASYASPRLNMNVFENAEDITVKYDDMSKATTISSTSLLKGEGDIRLDYDYDYVSIYPRIIAITSADEIYFKIGNNLYQFGKIQMQNAWDNELNCYNETMMFPIDRNSINFMEDFETHRDDSIAVALVNGEQYIEFELTDDVKNGWLHLYDLYKKAGGTNKDNLDMVWLYSSGTYNAQTVS